MLASQHKFLNQSQQQPILLRTKDFIDLRSDVVSVAPPQMLKLMSQAQVGDDVFQDDPTANKFQQFAAQYFGFQSSMIVPSTTMANLISVLLYTKPGDQVIIWGNSHTVQRQSAGIALIAGVQTRQILQQSGIFTLDQIKKRIRKSSQHITFPDTSLIMIQNATYTGQVWPLQTLKQLKQYAQKQNINILIDGARILNAISYYNINAKQISKYCNIMTMCLSKGLCCPFGSLVFGSKQIITKARQVRKSLGGGMRQIGLIGAAGMYALQNMVKQIKLDNQMAIYIGSLLSKINGIVIDINKIQSNMVNYNINILNFNHGEYHRFMYVNGVRIKQFNQDRQEYRLVTHRTVRGRQVEKFVELTRRFIEENYGGKPEIEDDGQGLERKVEGEDKEKEKNDVKNDEKKQENNVKDNVNTTNTEQTTTINKKQTLPGQQVQKVDKTEPTKEQASKKQ